MSYTLNLCFAHRQLYAPQSARKSRNIKYNRENEKAHGTCLIKTHLLDSWLLIREVQKQMFLESITVLYTIFWNAGFYLL